MEVFVLNLLTEIAVGGSGAAGGTLARRSGVGQGGNDRQDRAAVGGQATLTGSLARALRTAACLIKQVSVGFAFNQARPCATPMRRKCREPTFRCRFAGRVRRGIRERRARGR